MTGIWLISYIALWILFLMVVIVLLSVLRNLGVIYEMVEKKRTEPIQTNLSIGALLPDITFHTLSGISRSTASFQGTKTAFSIVSPDCSACQSLLAELSKNNINPDPIDPTVQNSVIVSIGDVNSTVEITSKLSLDHSSILVDTEGEVAQEWGIRTTPTTVIVDDQLRVVRFVIGLDNAVSPN